MTPFKVLNKCFIDRLVETNFDDVGLLVYADWLAEQGDAAQEEAIRERVANPVNYSLKSSREWVKWEWKTEQVLGLKFSDHNVCSFISILRPNEVNLMWTSINRNLYSVVIHTGELKIYE
jgi:uncharacterized protein (TIGR02996 family)